MLDNGKNFTNLKIHTQYSICEGAIKIDDLAEYCKSILIAPSQIEYCV